MKTALSFLAILLYVTSVMSVTHYVVLSSDQVLERVDSFAKGFGVFEWNEATMELKWAIFHNATNVQAAHIHGPGLPGVPGPVIITLPTTNTIVGMATLTSSQAAEMDMGRWYVNIHTVRVTEGEIRGQILNKWQSMCVLTGMNEVPPNNSTKRGFGFITVDPMMMKFSYNIVHNVMATAAHVHGPADETMGGLPVLFGLKATSPTMYMGEVNMTAAWMKHFWEGKLYFNIHSAAFPAGDVRCQIMPPVSYAAWLSGMNEVPANPSTAVGAALAWKRFGMDGSMWLRTMVAHNLSVNVTGAHIHGPAPVGMTAGVVFNIGTMTRHEMTYPLMNTMMMNHPDWLMNHHMYVNIHTTRIPSGEIRGQLMELDPMMMRPCPKGYHIPGSGICTICPAGTMSSMEDSMMCNMCMPGMFSHVGSSMCMFCAAGTHAPMNGSSSCMTCPMGTMSTGGAAMCTPCAKGYFGTMDGMSFCMPCPAGTMQNRTGSTACMDCKMGTRSLGAAAMCTACPAGYFTDMDMMDNCKPCPAGWRSDKLTGSSKCAICPAGRFAAMAGMGACATCPKGYFSSGMGNTYCSPCPPGTFADLVGATTCKPCPMGMTSMGAAAMCM